MKTREIPYRSIYETSRDAIVLFNRKSCIDCNPATLKLFGLTNKEQLLDEKYRTDDKSVQLALATFRSYEQAVFEALFRADFSFKWSYLGGGQKIVTLETAIRAFEHQNDTIIMANIRDISLHVSQQTMIMEKEGRYRELIDNLHDGVMILHYDTRSDDFLIMELNKTAEGIEGKSARELLSHYLFECNPFLREHQLAQTLKKVNDTHVPESLVYHFSSSPDPQETVMGWRDANIFSLPNNELALVYRDISLQRQVEREIIKLSQALKQIPSMVVITDKNGLIEYVNPKFTEVTGYEISEVINQNPKILASGRTDPSIYQNMWETIRSGAIWRGEFVNRRKNGQFYTEALSITPIKQNSGEITNYLAIKEDVTEQNMTQNRLKESEERFRNLFEESQDMIYICSPDGTILNINSAGVDMLGYPGKPALLKENMKNLYQDESLWNNKIDILSYTKGMKELETVMIRQNGSAIFVTESINAVYDADKELVALRGFVRDVSDTVRRRKELEATNAELKEANLRIQKTQSQLIQQEKLASIGNLAAGIAHELNNPLGFVSSNFMTLQKYMNLFIEYINIWSQINRESLSPDQKRAIADQAAAFYRDRQMDFILKDLGDLFSESEDGLRRMNSIVENMRSFSRIDSSGSVALYDINQGIENTLIVARNEIKYVADVRKELAPIESFMCRGDQINQVLLNIVVNAAQAIKEQARQDRGTIIIRTRQEQDDIVCEIQDDGPGIPPEIQNKIFDPFFTTKPVGKGTGLGLNISYDIVVNKHKGLLSVDSEPGKGSLFTIRIPRKPAEKEEMTA